jgi:bifunctional non-homologous end joining protein LigD
MAAPGAATRAKEKLAEYRRKRNFATTPEPPGEAAPAPAGRSFVVQKHDATRLHYDFRLEMEGVLRSWAVPKGPSLDPADKRLAVETEDHPVEYGGFEGVIPPNEYGAGPVVLWDRGTWEPEGDPVAGYRAGRLKFRLDGEKLRGSWALVKTRGRDRRSADRSWLLFKLKDDEARPDVDIAASRPESVESGRTIDDVAAGRAARKREAKRKPAKENVVAGVRLTHPDRVLYDPPGTTKLDLATYYVGVESRMLPHLEGRPLVLVRCPDGAHRECFFQKHAGRYVPDALRRVEIREAKKTGEYLVADDLAGLVGLVQMGVLEIHGWGSRAERLEQPDRLVFDIDPDEGLPWERVATAARLLRERLEALDFATFLESTGGKGLHVVVPLRPDAGWEEAKAFAQGLAFDVVRAEPAAYVAEASKARRKGKVFIDYLRNYRGASAIVPYSTRARAGAPIAMPLSWDELGKNPLADSWTIRNAVQRLREADPWREFFSSRQRLTASRIRSVGKAESTKPPGS